MKNRPTIVANCLVCNEERWVWYAINSVIDYVDKVLVYDTGSTDRTVEIIKSIKSPKIELHEKGKVDPLGFTKMRQEMLDKTDADWLLILDGDDIWPEATIQELISKIQHASPIHKAVHVGYWNCVGDVFHYSKEVARLDYPIAPKGIKGWMSARVIRRNIGGLHCVGIHGNQGYADKRGKDTVSWGDDANVILQNKYFHMSYLPRSSSRKKDKEVAFRGQKTRFYKGIPFPKSMIYPNVFYKKKPALVTSPWKRITLTEELIGIYYRGQNFIERLQKGSKIRGLAH